MSDTRTAMETLAERGSRQGPYYVYDSSVEQVTAEQASLSDHRDLAPVVESRSDHAGRRAAAGGREAMALVAGFAVVIVSIGLAGLLTRGSSEVATEPTTATLPRTESSVPTTAQAATAPPVVGTISELHGEEVPYLAKIAPYPAGRVHGEEHIAQVLAETGIDYDPTPVYAHDAVIVDGRAVFVGVDAGIWYSDNGTWLPATINLPAGVTIGSNVGEYRLADGIQNIATDGTRIVAWEYIQVWGSGQARQEPDPVGAGTLILTSLDGRSWTGTVTSEGISAVIPWGDGYIGSIYGPLPDLSGGSQFGLAWSSDLITWAQFQDLGEGVAGAIELDTAGLVIWFEDHSLPELPGEDGNPHSEDDPWNPYLRAFRVELTRP